jgi:hypothetical protein
MIIRMTSASSDERIIKANEEFAAMHGEVVNCNPYSIGEVFIGIVDVKVEDESLVNQVMSGLGTAQECYSVVKWCS